MVVHELFETLSSWIQNIQDSSKRSCNNVQTLQNFSRCVHESNILPDPFETISGLAETWYDLQIYLGP